MLFFLLGDVYSQDSANRKGKQKESIDEGNFDLEHTYQHFMAHCLDRKVLLERDFCSKFLESIKFEHLKSLLIGVSSHCLGVNMIAL